MSFMKSLFIFLIITLTFGVLTLKLYDFLYLFKAGLAIRLGTKIDNVFKLSFENNFLKYRDLYLSINKDKLFWKPSRIILSETISNIQSIVINTEHKYSYYAYGIVKRWYGDEQKIDVKLYNGREITVKITDNTPIINLRYSEKDMRVSLTTGISTLCPNDIVRIFSYDSAKLARKKELQPESIIVERSFCNL